jgi:hypothetical protein
MDEQKIRDSRNGGKVFHERYSEERLNAIKRIVETQQSQGKQKRYSISVDGEMIINNTADLELFDTYLEYIEPHTEKIEVRLYFGVSPNGNRYVFHLKEKPFNGLGDPGKPVHVNDMIADALERQSVESELIELRRKYKKLKRKYRVAEAELSDKQMDMKDLLSQGMQLYGAFNAQKGASQQMQGLPPVEEVQIERELSEADKFYEELKNQVGEDKLTAALKTWAVFATHPELRSEFQAIVNQKN